MCKQETENEKVYENLKKKQQQNHNTQVCVRSGALVILKSITVLAVNF